MRRHGIAGRWLGWRASHGRDRAGPALVLEQPLAGGGAPTVPWLLVPCPFVAFPGGEPLGSPACCLGNAVELQRFVQRPSSEGHQGSLFLRLRTPSRRHPSAVRSPVGPGWERAFLLLPLEGAAWGSGKAGWGWALPSSPAGSEQSWARGLAPGIAQGNLSQLRSVAPREGHTQDGAGSPILTRKCWKCLQEASRLPSTRCTCQL